MNQGNKFISVHLEEKEKNDYLVFDFEEEKAVCLNSENSQNDLLEVFNVLLQKLIKEPIELRYEKNPEYTKRLYIDVCEEYIKDLNIEVSRVRKNIPESISIPIPIKE